MAPHTGKVDYWMNSNQRQRWVLPPALLDIEPGLRRIRGYCHLPASHHALQVELNLLSNCEENWRSATMGATSISLKIEYGFYYTTNLRRKRFFNPLCREFIICRGL